MITRCERRAVARGRELVRRFVSEDGGQDLVEYALITAFFGIVGALALQAIQVAVGSTYDTWLDPAAGVPSLWTPPEP
jgi:Flp pilus assembly pilin Flp